MMTLSKQAIILALITAVTILTVWTIIGNTSSGFESPSSPSQPSSLTPQTSDQANVLVEVTPLTLKPGFPPSFDITFETHSVELDFDVEKIASLTDDNRTAYKPTWQGSPPGGHHRSGTLIFTPDIPKQTTITLTFKDIAGVPERIFEWSTMK